MTDVAHIQAMAEEVNPADLVYLPYREQFLNGYAINTESANAALGEISAAGRDYRVQIYVTNADDMRYPVFFNEGIDNGIGADGLIDKMNKEGLTLPEAIQTYTGGLVQADEIAFYQLEFTEEKHRSNWNG